MSSLLIRLLLPVLVLGLGRPGAGLARRGDASSSLIRPVTPLRTAASRRDDSSAAVQASTRTPYPLDFTLRSLPALPKVHPSSYFDFEQVPTNASNPLLIEFARITHAFPIDLNLDAEPIFTAATIAAAATICHRATCVHPLPSATTAPTRLQSVFLLLFGWPSSAQQLLLDAQLLALVPGLVPAGQRVLENTI